MSDYLINKKLEIRSNCSLCNKELWGELYHYDPMSLYHISLKYKGSRTVAYQCQNCENFLCSDCEKKNVKHRFLGIWHKKDSHCPVCNDPIFPSPLKVILQRKKRKKPPITEIVFNSEYLGGNINLPDWESYCSLDGPDFDFELTKKYLAAEKKPNGEGSRKIPLENIIAVDISSGKAMLIFELYRLLIKTNSEEVAPGWIEINASMNYYDTYMLAKTLSQLTNSSFCKPIAIDKSRNGCDLVEFHVKEDGLWSEEDIIWPQKCSSCLSEQNVKLEKKEIIRGESIKELYATKIIESWLGVPVITQNIGALGVTFFIPRCTTCTEGNKVGVVLARFDGVRVIAEFRNEEYLEEFVHLNE